MRIQTDFQSLLEVMEYMYVPGVILVIGTMDPTSTQKTGF